TCRRRRHPSRFSPSGARSQATPLRAARGVRRSGSSWESSSSSACICFCHEGARTMIPPPFDCHAPKTLPDALALLGQFGDEAKVLSGGQSLLPMMKLRFAQPAHLVDIGRIPGLDYIKEEGGFLKIGALAREAGLEAAEIVRSKYPILVDTASVIADPLVRNLATVAGNLAHGDPANDHPATMLALGAEVVATGAKGARTIPITQFFTGLFTTALTPSEVLTEIRI